MTSVSRTLILHRVWYWPLYVMTAAVVYTWVWSLKYGSYLFNPRPFILKYLSMWGNNIQKCKFNLQLLIWHSFGTWSTHTLSVCLPCKCSPGVSMKKYPQWQFEDKQEIQSISPIPVPDLCRAISGDDVSSQHLKGRGFSSSIHTQQTKALYGNTVAW